MRDMCLRRNPVCNSENVAGRLRRVSHGDCSLQMQVNIAVFVSEYKIKVYGEGSDPGKKVEQRCNDNSKENLKEEAIKMDVNISVAQC